MKLFDATIKNRGLYIAGSRYSAVNDTLRRCRGVNLNLPGTLTSRWGSTKLYDLAAHSLVRHHDARFAGVGTQLYRNGSSIDTGYDGTRLSFVKMPPSPDVEIGGTQTGLMVRQAGSPITQDYLFVAGGGRLRKVDNAGNPSNWGIAAPTTNFTAVKQSPLQRVIDVMDDQSTWTGVSATLANEATIKQEGANALKMTVVASTVGSASKANIIDLSTFPTTGVASAVEDFISIWCRVDNPANIESLQLIFDVEDGSFAVNTFSIVIPVLFDTIPTAQLAEQTIGLGSVVPIDEEDFLIRHNTDDPESLGKPTSAELTRILGELSQGSVMLGQNLWTKLRIPKSLFNQTGPTSRTWTNVKAVKLIAKTNARGTVIVYWDLLVMEGGSGMLGTYKYLVTFKNSATGSRSNCNPVEITVENVTRQSVRLTGFPTTTDTQVDKIEVWRTVGNGAEFFLDATLAANTPEYIDTISDLVGMNSINGEVTLDPTVLPLDNIPPESTYEFCFGPYLGRMWWCADSVTGARSRVYYSPVGRAEAVEGFINCSSDSEPTKCGVVFNEQAFVFSEAKIYRILGDTEPFQAIEVYGCPGTSWPETVKVTPRGIAYRALDGPRLFTGAQSMLADIDPVKPLFRGEAEYLTQVFNFDVAAYRNNEYVMSDGVSTLAYNDVERSWRDLGIGCAALYYEDDTGEVITSFSNKILILEDEGVVTGDDSVGIVFNVEFNSMTTTLNSAAYIRMLYIDCTIPAGQSIVPYLVLNDTDDEGDVTVTLPAIPSTSGVPRHVELPIDRAGKVIGVGFTGTLTARVIISNVEMDVYNVEAA